MTDLSLIEQLKIAITSRELERALSLVDQLLLSDDGLARVRPGEPIFVLRGADDEVERPAAAGEDRLREELALAIINAFQLKADGPVTADEFASWREGDKVHALRQADAVLAYAAEQTARAGAEAKRVWTVYSEFRRAVAEAVYPAGGYAAGREADEILHRLRDQIAGKERAEALVVALITELKLEHENTIYTAASGHRAIGDLGSACSVCALLANPDAAPLVAERRALEVVGETPGRSWSVPSRPRVDLHPLQQRLKWEAS